MKCIKVTTDILARDQVEYEIDNNIFPGETKDDLERAMRAHLEADENIIYQNDEEEINKRLGELLEDGTHKEGEFKIGVVDYDGASNSALFTARVIEVADWSVILNRIHQTVRSAEGNELEIVRLANRLGLTWGKK